MSTENHLGTLGAAGLLGGTPYVPPPAKFSFNRFVVAPYLSDRQIKTATSTGSTGFAVIQQKVSVIPLRLLVDARLELNEGQVDGKGYTHTVPTVVKAGSLVYIKEEFLHSQEWGKRTYEAEGVGKFMLVDKQFVEFIQPL